MITRRLPNTPATPQLTGGEDRPEPACLGKPLPYDVLIDFKSGPAFESALREARRICGTCPIQLACIRDNRDEPWARALVGASKPGPKPQPPGYRECEGCGVPMVGNKQPRPDGFAEHGGRGLCLACYSAARRRRERAA